VVAKVRERLAVSKQTTQRVHTERFNLKILSEVEGKERYRGEISNRFAALENLDTEGDVNKAWETIRENIKISAKEGLGYYEPKIFNMKLYLFLCYEYCKIKSVVCTFTVSIFLSQHITSFPLFYIKIGTEEKCQYLKTAILKTRGTIYRIGIKRGTQVEKGWEPLF
jgi:hypothetical protein